MRYKGASIFRTCTRKAIGSMVVAALCFAVHVLYQRPVHAQSATLRGFVSDASTGGPLELAHVVLQGAEDRLHGSATNQDGLYSLRSIPPGQYILRVSAIGYSFHRDTVTVQASEVRTLNVSLQPSDVELDEVVVESERTGGAARTTAGHQVIRPEDIELLPAPDVSRDLGAYLVAQPGVVASGDRGGQIFVRGGEPTHNLFLLDGIPLVQPFHVFGPYSAFPAEIIQRADVYSAGFGSAYTGRLSAVFDVTSRPGNRYSFVGSGGLSPFVSSIHLEGPILPGHSSFLVSVRESTLEEFGDAFIDERLPFDFGDTFVRLQSIISSSSQLAVTGLRTHDRGRLVEASGGVPPEDVRWTNEGLGVRYLVLPTIIPVVLELHASHSRFDTELGRTDKPARHSSVRHTRATVEANFFGERLDMSAGWQLDVIRLRSELDGLFQARHQQSTPLSPSGFYLEPDILVGRGLRVQPGLRLQFFGVRFDPFLVPRLRLQWDVGRHQVSAAVGVFRQEVIGLNDRRDAASVFTVWTRVPREDPNSSDAPNTNLGRAVHAVVGYRVSPIEGIEWSVEGFYKRVSDLVIAEWTPFPRLTTRMQPASGRSSGAETRIEFRAGPLTAFVNYGLSSTVYQAEQASLQVWYGETSLRFRPPHDRRHQVNVVANASWRSLGFSVHWEYGSGLPFNRAIGFDGFALIEDIVDIAQIPRSRRVIYEEPYQGVLPAYHRLDASATWSTDLGRHASLSLQASVINVYDRRNVFYLDVFTLRRVDQLPLVPTLGVQVSFK